VRSEAIMVEVSVPGERWEVEFFADSHVEIEVFRASGVKGEETFEEILEKFGN
jgi:hypothetical protein